MAFNGHYWFEWVTDDIGLTTKVIKGDLTVKVFESVVRRVSAYELAG